MASSHRQTYEVKPIKLGAEVRGVELATESRRKVIKRIVKDVTKHRLLIFKDQGQISGPRQVEISKWFGELESTFFQHPKSPDKDVFRVSNDQQEGCTGVGRTGWHIDGFFMQKPFSHALYHMVAVPSQGATEFIPLTELIESLSEARRGLWQRVWLVHSLNNGPIHPLIYPHPITGKPVMCFHLGMAEGAWLDFDTDDRQLLEFSEFRNVLAQVHDEITKENGHLIYQHHWEPGDFIMSDNLAVAHQASPQTQYSKNLVGLRILHRTTIKGRFQPTKLFLKAKPQPPQPSPST